MIYYLVSSFINFLTSAILGAYLFLAHKGAVIRVFSLWCLSVAGWSLGYFFWQIAHSSQEALLWTKVLMSFAIIIPVLILHFTIQFLDLYEKKAPLIFLYYGLSLIYLVADVFTNTFISTVSPELFFPHWPKPGLLFHPYLAMFLSSVAYSHYLLWREMRSASGVRRIQIQYVFWGVLIAFLGGSTNFPLWYGVPILPIGNGFVIVYVLTITYAIVRHQLMDIEVIITTAGLLLGTYLIVLGAPFLVGWWGRNWLEARVGPNWWLIPLLLCTILATIGPFAYAYLRRQAEARLLKEQRRYQRTLQLASRGMTQVRNVGRLCNLITRLVSRTVGMTHASLFLWDETHQHYMLSASHGPNRLSLQSRYALEEGHPLIRWLREHHQALTTDEAAQHPESTLGRELAKLDASLVIPGLMQHRLIGFLALGPKRSGGGYSGDDLHAFSTLANEAAVAIENATSYEELLKVNEQLKVASERLLRQERLAAAGQFAAGMAHEIKNPLSAIKTFAQYLPEKYGDPAFREKFFRIVQEEIDRINTIIKELSDFAKPAPLQLKPIRLADLVADTLALLSNQCLKQGIEIHHTSQEHEVLISADPQQLKQVLLNLLLNGIEAMDGGGRLEVATQVKGAKLVLRIMDTGTGIAPECLNQVWDPFFTTKERGMGLGMAIVKGVVERHGGSIDLSSAIGKGTTVEVSLPLASS